MDAGARSFYDTKRPIKSIDDLKGLKIRVIGNPMFVDMANALGANGVAMGYDQVFSALQTGVIDGAENNPPSFVFDNHYQVAKYYTLTPAPDRAGDAGLFASAAGTAAAGRPGAGQETRARGAARCARPVEQDRGRRDRPDEERPASRSITIADKKPFRDAVKPVWDKYGSKFADMIKRIDAVS